MVYGGVFERMRSAFRILGESPPLGSGLIGNLCHRGDSDHYSGMEKADIQNDLFDVATYVYRECNSSTTR